MGARERRKSPEQKEQEAKEDREYEDRRRKNRAKIQRELTAREDYHEGSNGFNIMVLAGKYNKCFEPKRLSFQDERLCRTVPMAQAKGDKVKYTIPRQTVFARKMKKYEIDPTTTEFLEASPKKDDTWDKYNKFVIKNVFEMDDFGNRSQKPTKTLTFCQKDKEGNV